MMTASVETPAHRSLSWRVILLLSLGVFILLLGRSMNRDLDKDEHQFVAPPALLVQDHLLPYVDYPYFHMPNLVFIYAALTGWTSYKLLAARVVMTLCGTGTVVLLIVAAWEMTGRWAIAGGVPLIFMCSRLFTYTDGWAWNHDMPTFCALGAFLLHVRGMRRGAIAPIVLAGFLLGLATGIRLSFALAPIPFALFLLFGKSSLSRKRRVIALVLGAVAVFLAVSPAIWLMIKSPDQFFFGNLRYPHLSTQFYRSIHYSRGMTLPGKLLVLPEKMLDAPANWPLVILSVLALFFLDLRRFSGEVIFLIGMLAALGIGALGPTPFQPQYSYMLAPFMAMMIVYGVVELVRTDLVTANVWMKLIALVGCIIGAIIFPLEYWGVAFLASPSRWLPVQQHRRAEWIKENVGPHARIMTTETTVPLEAGLDIYPQYAVGRFVLLVAKFQTEADRRKYGMVSTVELPALLADRPPDAVFSRSTLELDQWASAHNYHPIPYDKEYTLWVRPH